MSAQSSNPKPTPEKESKPATAITWLVVALVAIATAAYTLVRRNESLDMAYMTGNAFGVAFFVYLIAYFCALRKRGAMVGTVAFLVIATAAIVGTGIGVARDREDAKNRVAAMEMHFNQTTQAMLKGEKVEVPAVSVAPPGNNDYAQMERFMRDWMNALASFQNEYLVALSASGWNNILEPSRLSKDSKFSDSQRIIGEAKQLVIKYHKRMDEMYETLPQRVDGMDASRSFKRGFAEGVVKGMEKNRARMQRQWDLEMMIVEEVERMVVFLKNRPDAWVVQNGKLLFRTDRDMQQYRSHVAQLQKYTAEQESIRKESVESAQAKLQALKKF